MNVILFVSLCQAVATCRRRERTSLMLWFVVCNVGLGCALFFSSSMPAFSKAPCCVHGRNAGAYFFQSIVVFRNKMKKDSLRLLFTHCQFCVGNYGSGCRLWSAVLEIMDISLFTCYGWSKLSIKKYHRSKATVVSC